MNQAAAEFSFLGKNINIFAVNLPLSDDRAIVEGDRCLAEGVGEADARLGSPDIGLHDQPEALVVGALLGRREGELQLGLRRRIADRVGTLRGARPARSPGLGVRGGGGEGAQNR